MNAEDARKLTNNYLFTKEPLSSFKEAILVVKHAACIGLSDVNFYVRKEFSDSIKSKFSQKGYLATVESEDALVISVLMNVSWRGDEGYGF